MTSSNGNIFRVTGPLCVEFTGPDEYSVYVMCSLQKSSINLNFPFSLNMNGFTSYDYYMSMPHIYNIYVNRSREISCHSNGHNDVNKWKLFPRYWPFVRGIHRSPVNSPHKGQWRGDLMFSLIYFRINVWINNREAGDLRRHRAHYGATVMLNQAWVALGWEHCNSDSDVTDWLTYSRTYCLHCSVWLIKVPVNETRLLGNGDTVNRSRWIPHTKASDAELWCFLWSAPK